MAFLMHNFPQKGGLGGGGGPGPYALHGLDHQLSSSLSFFFPDRIIHQSENKPQTAADDFCRAPKKTRFERQMNSRVTVWKTSH
jgi:hypothetical protein